MLSPYLHPKYEATRLDTTRTHSMFHEKRREKFPHLREEKTFE